MMKFKYIELILWLIVGLLNIASGDISMVSFVCVWTALIFYIIQSIFMGDKR